MTRFEIKKDSFEFRFNQWKDSIPDMTSDEIFDSYLSESCNDPELIASYDTEEEALEAWKDYENQSFTKAQKGNVWWLLIGNVYFIEINDYDENGDFDQGGDILRCSAEAYEKDE